MRRKYILALDSGTVKNRAVIFNQDGDIVSYAEKNLGLYRSHDGWAEQDADEIWSTQLSAMREAINIAGISKKDISCIGITNQRETSIVWNRSTGRPICSAINWQSRQTEGICEQLRKEGLQEEIHQKTSLIINPYFSATKIRWILDNVLGAREMAEQGDLAFGTVDTWLMWKLSGGQIFATDYSNASRTMMFHLRNLKWDEEILEHLGIPEKLLPAVYPSAHFYGMTDAQITDMPIPITGCIGNQQADLFGEACFEPGMAKNTYGEGSFFLMNMGKNFSYSNNGLITTIAWGIGDEVTYALEVSVFVSGLTLRWLKQSLGLLRSMSDSEWMAKQVADTGGVYFVPAFRGMFAPYWDTQTNGMIIGLTESTEKAHIIRAALESLAYQVRDVYEAVVPDTNLNITELRVDGGASQNNLLMQFQADILKIPVIRPYTTETTALGAAYIAGLASGVWKDLDELKSLWHESLRFLPQMSDEKRNTLYDGWQNAVSKVLVWANG